MAIDRDAINAAVYNGMRTVSTGITPPGIPGFAENLCDYCATTPTVPRPPTTSGWPPATSRQSIPIQFNADAGHEPVVADHRRQPAGDRHRGGTRSIGSPRRTSPSLADGACVLCRLGWTADYPTYDNFMYDQFHTESLDGNNYGYINEEFDALIDEAKATTDPDARAQLYNGAEDILLNQDVGAVPINWYLGDYAYDPDTLSGFGQNPLALIMWEQITVTR